MVDFKDPQIMSAIISGGLGLLAAIIASTVAAVIGKKFADTDKLKKKLETAAQDINFLLEVEKQHVNLNGDKIGIRSKVKKDGLLWSGKFIPSRLNRYMQD